MNFKSLSASLVVLALAACTTPTAFVPATGGGPGYSDERLATNRYRVTFVGNSATKRNMVENFLLLRSAEVARDAGFDWFEFDTRNTQAKTTYHTDFADYPGFGPSFGWYWHSWAYDPWDPYWRSSSTAFPTTQYEAYAEIILLTPDQAKADPHALQASDVITRLGPQAAPPPASN
ncbi:MAG TPA: hypothetical protein VGB91_17195 [Rhizomicrobium sp.]